MPGCVTKVLVIFHSSEAGKSAKPTTISGPIAAGFEMAIDVEVPWGMVSVPMSDETEPATEGPIGCGGPLAFDVDAGEVVVEWPDLLGPIEARPAIVIETPVDAPERAVELSAIDFVGHRLPIEDCIGDVDIVIRLMVGQETPSKAVFSRETQNGADWIVDVLGRDAGERFVASIGADPTPGRGVEAESPAVTCDRVHFEVELDDPTERRVQANVVGDFGSSVYPGEPYEGSEEERIHGEEFTMSP